MEANKNHVGKDPLAFALSPPWAPQGPPRSQDQDPADLCGEKDDGRYSHYALVVSAWSRTGIWLRPKLRKTEVRPTFMTIAVEKILILRCHLEVPYLQRTFTYPAILVWTLVGPVGLRRPSRGFVEITDNVSNNRPSQICSLRKWDELGIP